MVDGSYINVLLLSTIAVIITFDNVYKSNILVVGRRGSPDTGLTEKLFKKELKGGIPNLVLDESQ